jgi:hypothetical protein
MMHTQPAVHPHLDPTHAEIYLTLAGNLCSAFLGIALFAADRDPTTLVDSFNNSCLL